MRSKREYAAALALVVVAAATITWQNYYPRSQMFQSLAMPGPRANSGRSCGASYRKSTWGPVMTREVTCSGPGTSLGPWNEQEVKLDRLTRRITSAHRTWPLADSSARVAAEDSVQRVLGASGGVAINCPAPTQVPGQTVTVQTWRFPTYSVRLDAYHWERALHPDASFQPPEWTLQLIGYPGDPPGCGSYADTHQR